MWSQNFFSDWESWWSALIGTALSRNLLGNSQPIGEFVCYLTMIHLWYTLCITHLWKDCRLADWGIAVLVMSFGFGDRDLVTWSNSTDSTSWWSNQLVTSKLLTMRTAGFDVDRFTWATINHPFYLLNWALNLPLFRLHYLLPISSDLYTCYRALRRTPKTFQFITCNSSLERWSFTGSATVYRRRIISFEATYADDLQLHSGSFRRKRWRFKKKMEVQEEEMEV